MTVKMSFRKSLEKVQTIQIHITLSTIRNKLGAHNTTKNHKDFEINKIYLILCCNDENIKQLLYIFVPIIVLKRPTKHLKLCQIVPDF